MAEPVARRGSAYLPVETGSKTTPRRLAITLALALAFAVAANLFAVVALPHLPANLGYWLVQHKWRMLDELDGPVDWLVLGDSSVNQGLDCRLFDRLVDGTSINLGTTAVMTMVNDAWMLETYLEKHGPPKGVLVVHVYQMWDSDARAVGISEVPRPWGFWERAHPPILLSEEDRREVLLQRYLPLYAKHSSIGDMLRHPLRTIHWRQSVDAQGFMSCADCLPARIEAERRKHLELLRRGVHVSKDNRRALVRIKQLAERHRFDVYLADSPILDELAMDPAFGPCMVQLHDEIRLIVGSSRHVHFLPSFLACFPARWMNNGVDHVNVEGAREYTRRLGDSIRRVEQEVASRRAPRERK